MLTELDYALDTVSDVVKSWVGFRPTGSFMDRFRLNDDGTPRTAEEVYAKLDSWLEQEKVRAEDEDAHDEWENQVNAEIDATSWLEGS